MHDYSITLRLLDSGASTDHQGLWYAMSIIRRRALVPDPAPRSNQATRHSYYHPQTSNLLEQPLLTENTALALEFIAIAIAIYTRTS